MLLEHDRSLKHRPPTITASSQEKNNSMPKRSQGASSYFLGIHT